MSNTIRFTPKSPPYAQASSPSNSEKQCQSRAKKRQRTTESSPQVLQSLFSDATKPPSRRPGRSPSIPQTNSTSIRGRQNNKGRQSLSASVLEAIASETQGPPSPVSSPRKQLSVERPPAPRRPEAVRPRQLHSAERIRYDAARNGSTTTVREKQVENKRGRSKVGAVNGFGVPEDSGPDGIIHSVPVLPRMREERSINVTNCVTNHDRGKRLSSSKVAKSATCTSIDKVETMSNARTTVFKAGRPTDQRCYAQAEAGEGLILQRKNTPRKARSLTDEKWTEAVVPAQILHDEIQRYKEELQKDGNCVAPEVDRALDAWHANVAKRLVEQNQLVRQNIDAAHHEKLVRRLVDSTRGDLMFARTDARRLEEDLRQLKSTVEERKVWNADRQVASRFLHALDRLRR
jgi:hypothetical protein